MIELWPINTKSQGQSAITGAAILECIVNLYDSSQAKNPTCAAAFFHKKITAAYRFTYTCLTDNSERDRLMPDKLITPYFGQWESPELIGQFVRQELRSDEDPNWKDSGAETAAEYAQWARHICGMACLKMVLAAIHKEVHPTMHLMRLAKQYGGYIAEGDEIKGLIYAPFVVMIKEQFGLQAEVITPIEAQDIAAQLKTYDYFLASVHPTIRHPQDAPPKQGGHLVLVTQANNEQGITFHNPSGDRQENQQNANVSIETFAQFFAGRGIGVVRRSIS
ncbi:hypothetical protein OAC10_00985 [bacterium]|nr:hypothetical protein [bacterium]